MKAIFIAGTDTGIGKTVVTGLLGRYLIGKKYNVVTQKWIQTGNRDFSRDISAHLKFMGKEKKDFKDYLSFMAPYILRIPVSPHLASRLEKKNIDINKIKKSFTALSRHFDIVIIEGTGGLLVPLNKRLLMIDVVRRFDLPVLLVAGNRLGAINHTLLSIEALRSRGIKILGVVFNNILKGEDVMVLKDNARAIKKLAGINVFGTLPYACDLSLLHKRFGSIAKRIAAKL